MNSSNPEIPTIGAAMGGGFFAGRIRLDDGKSYALIVAPKLEGSPAINVPWIDNYQEISGAKSYNDGLANTIAMAEAGSDLAKWARDLRIGGNDDWYIPSQDELEVIYRNLKPTAEKNSLYGRSGINLSAIEPTRPYTPDSPVQTQAEAFQHEGSEAFDPVWYWSSTQHAAYSDFAWSQNFNVGGQDYYDTSYKLRARAVRRLEIQ